MYKNITCRIKISFLKIIIEIGKQIIIRTRDSKLRTLILEQFHFLMD